MGQDGARRAQAPGVRARFGRVRFVGVGGLATESRLATSRGRVAADGALGDVPVLRVLLLVLQEGFLVRVEQEGADVGVRVAVVVVGHLSKDLHHAEVLPGVGTVYESPARRDRAVEAEHVEGFVRALEPSVEDVREPVPVLAVARVESLRVESRGEAEARGETRDFKWAAGEARNVNLFFGGQKRAHWARDTCARAPGTPA